SQDCSVCGTRIQKTLSTRTHQCPNYQTVLDRDHNAAINILKKGLKYLGNYLNASTLRRSSGDTSLGIDPSTLLRVNTERSRSVNGTVGQTETDPNALGESGLWVLNGDIENLSCL
ncbi:MAG: zinc ribbon domain-containing protein, partial [Microcystis panniformis]